MGNNLYDVTKLSFDYSLFGKGEDLQYIISMNAGLERIIILKMIPKRDMYRRGLERNHKELTSMEVVASALVNALEAYHNIDQLTAQRYGLILSAFEMFIDVQSKSYEYMKNFAEEAGMKL